MSLWLNLIPQLHRPGEGDDISMRHHHFQEEGDQYYDGIFLNASLILLKVDGAASLMLFLLLLV